MFLLIEKTPLFAVTLHGGFIAARICHDLLNDFEAAVNETLNQKLTQTSI